MPQEKVVAATLLTMQTQTTDAVIPIAGTTAGNTFTPLPNPMAGQKLWDHALFMVRNSAAMSGTFTMELWATVAGITGFPIARQLSVTSLVATGMTTIPSLTQGSAMPTPTHVFVDNTSAGGITCTIEVLAKANRGRRLGAATTDVWEGTLDSVTTNFTDPRLTAVTTFALNKCMMVDRSAFFINATAVSGTWQAWVLGTYRGRTVTLARTATFSAATKAPLVNIHFGAALAPTHVLWDSTAGVSASITASLVGIGKTSRGRRDKI